MEKDEAGVLNVQDARKRDEGGWFGIEKRNVKALQRLSSCGQGNEHGITTRNGECAVR